uniref:Serine/threonine-protein kinase BSK1-like TPR repeats domain-containing protein n=1 Tax=Oryza rufipogon TaxID=4529 RepID=A0A0E0QN15_ORYRU
MEEKGMGKQRWEKMLLQAAFDGNLRLLRKMARGLVTTGRGRGEADVLAAVAGGGRGGPREPRAAPGGHRGEDGRPHVPRRGPPPRRETPLFLSAFFGRTASTRYLLDHGADPMIVGKSGSPLHAAAGKGHCEIVELLLSRGIGIPDKVFNLDDTPLNMAISSKSLECVKLLIQAGADVNFRDSNGATYVMMAANYGFSGIMKCLLDAGANPNIPDQFGVFPIEVAALQVHREIVEMLFPLTSPISTVPDWSIDGIFAHAKNFGSKPLPEDLCVKKIAQMKVEGKEAFKRKDYLLAAQLYTSALGLGPSPDDSATLLANRSLCWLRLENGKQALADANMCRMFRPHWIKACYRQGAAFMLLKEYGNACDAFSDGLKLDPANVDIENALRAALQAVKNDRCVKNNQ